MTSRAAMGGGRGDWLGAGPGDLTGQIHLRNERDHERREAGIRQTKLALGDGRPVELVSVAVGVEQVEYAIPRAVVRHLIQQGVQSD